MKYYFGLYICYSSVKFNLNHFKIFLEKITVLRFRVIEMKLLSVLLRYIYSNTNLA
jgi:hypothetical protein